ncbi:MAG TPA: hypothetical protein VL738_30385 [Dactylosporangium sp.]|nr:hypothetical protein [Dactylosporangium sp.]
MTPDTIIAALSGTLPERPYFDPDDRIRWLAARFDAGDREGAAQALLGDLGGAERPPPGLAEDGPRILAALPPAEVLEGLLKSPHVYARFRDQLGDHPDDIVAGVFARCVTGGPDDEEALLRAALAPTDHERTYRGGGYRPVRVSAVLAGLAETVAADSGRDAGETLERWAAVLAESEYADGHRLAAAAALLAPLGLAEVDRRCDRVEDYDGPRLAAALARAGRLGEALELTTRIGPWERQRALLGLADIADDAGLAKVHAAFRKAPKADRSRDAQMVWKHRLASLALRRGLVDDAVATLAAMKDCRIVDHGPAPLALEILRWLAERPAEATPERLRAVADVLAAPAVIPQELAAVVTESLLLLFRLADPALRAELSGARVPALRGRLSWNPPILVDAGAAAAAVEAGDRLALDDVLDHPRLRAVSRIRALIDVVVASGLPERRPGLAARMAVEATVYPGHPRNVAGLLPPVAREHLAAAFAALNAIEAKGVAAALSREAVEDDLLAAVLAAAPDVTARHAVARKAAAHFARAGDLPGALRIAEACGLPV